MRFLHLADVHLDTPFAGRSPALRRRLRDATRDAFARAVDLALAEAVDAVLIAGDFFDGARLSFESERFLLHQLGRLQEASIPVVYATGNHDPGMDEERPRAFPWPENVTVASDATPRRVDIRDSDGRLLGHVTAVGHAGRQETRDLAGLFPRPEGTHPEVALLHAQVVGSRDEGDHHPYAPVELEALRRSGYDYWALGHIHQRQALSDHPAVHYPGNLQGRTPAETGPKGALLVELDATGTAVVEFRALAPVRWETLVVEQLGEAATLAALLTLIDTEWASLRRSSAPDGGEWMVRVALRGASPLWSDLAEEANRRALAEDLRTRWAALDVEVWTRDVHAPVDLASHLGRGDVLGVALRHLTALRDGKGTLPDGVDGELAGWSPGDGVFLTSYVADLLDGAAAELVTRFLGPPRPGG